MKRPPMRRGPRELLFTAWLVIVVLLGVLVVAGDHGSRGGAAGRGKARTVDIERLRRRIRMHQLSDHPARHAAPVRR